MMGTVCARAKALLNSFFVHGMLIYMFPAKWLKQELAPFPQMEGCQRVIEPDLSPLLYKSKPF